MLKEGNYEGALQSFDKANKINPSKANAWFNKGLTFDKLNRYDEAIIAYDKAISIDSNNAATWNAKGTTLFNKGLYNESMTAYDKAVELESTNTEYQKNKQIALKKISDQNSVSNSSSAETPIVHANATSFQYLNLITLFNNVQTFLMLESLKRL